MIWLLLSVLAAFFESLKDVFGKQGLKHIDEYVVAWSWKLFALPVALIALAFSGIPPIGEKFWGALLAGGLVNFAATILYMKAIKHSDLSLTVPMIAFTPLFLLLTSPLILGEFPSLSGLFGVLLIVIGSYTLNIKKKGNGYFGPFRALLSEKGPRIMLLVAFLWSIGSTVDKIGVQSSSPIFWVVAIDLLIALAMVPLVLCKAKTRLPQLRSHLKVLVPIGVVSALGLICQMTAINLALVAYVIAIKRTSVLLTVMFGFFIFKEKGIRERFIGAAIMLCGVVFITL